GADQRHRPSPRRPGHRHRRAARGRRKAGRRLLSRHGPAVGRGVRPARQPADTGAGRTRQRSGPEGVRWMRTMLKGLAADGHTVFVSSHLMSEMAQTATRLVVIGRGRLIADTTVEEFVARASNHSVTVRTPETARLRDLLLGPDITVTTQQPDVLGVDGLTAEHIGTIAWQHQLP